VKRQKLIQHLTANACELLREGKRHSIYLNLATIRPRRYRDIQTLTRGLFE